MTDTRAQHASDADTGEAGTATDASTDTGSTAPDTGEQPTEDTGDESSNEETSVDYWKRRARENEARAKSNHKELEKLRREAMSDQERAIAEAREGARAETLREVSGRLVDAEVRSAAVNRPVNVDALLDGLDRSRFLDDDGNVDRDAVGTWLDQLAPVQQPKRPAADLGQGARGANRSTPEDVFGQMITGSLK